MKIAIAGTGYVGLSKLHALGWRDTVELEEETTQVYECYLKNKGKEL